MDKRTEVIQMVGSGLIKIGVYLSNKCVTIFLSRMCEIRKDEKTYRGGNNSQGISVKNKGWFSESVFVLFVRLF